jgi:hypothetical protein
MRRSGSRQRLAIVVLCALCVGAPQAFAQFQMPDPRQMSGIPRPVDDLPDGSVSVRLIRGQLTNNIPNHLVELHVGGKVLNATTDAAGRAQFDKLAAGAPVKASVEVDGERLESEEFPAPGRGGIRLMLVATDKSTGAAPNPGADAIAGQVALGANSRIVMEPRDEAVELYYLLEITNSARVPVTMNGPFVFSMPTGAAGCVLLEGSSPQASLSGPRVTVKGPFPPGGTSVQIGCELPVTDGLLDITQQFPATAETLSVIVKKVGSTKLASAQLTNQQEITAEGETYITAAGPAVAAGQPIALSLQDLPRHNPVPRWVALSLAVAIVLAGIWAATRTPRDADARAAERKRLVTQRNRFFDDLVRLERDYRTGRLDERRYAIRREQLIASLERVYGALDSDEAGPEPFDRDGVAA